MRLYLGLDKSRYPKDAYHLPLIKITPLPFTLERYESYTHLLFTSRSAVTLFAQYCTDKKEYIAVGPGTAAKLQEFGCSCSHIAAEHTQEGVIALLEKLSLPKVLFPHAQLARELLPNYLKERGHTAVAIYKTEKIPYKNPPELTQFEEIIFTSPQIVEAFVALYGQIPKNTILTTIGPITEARLQCYIS